MPGPRRTRTTVTEAMTGFDPLDEVGPIVRSGVDLADAVSTFLDMFPGDANPIPIPRSVLAPLEEARDAFLDASSDYVTVSVAPAAAAGPPPVGARTHAPDDPTPVGRGR